MLHLKLIVRNILKHRVNSLIEVAGLSVGLACFFIVTMHLKKELTFDNFFQDSERIYRVLNFEKGTGNRYSGQASALAVHARQEIPHLEEVTRAFFPYKMNSNSAVVQYGDKTFFEDQILDADSTFFRVFDFELIDGNAHTALREPNSVVISKEVALKYFGSLNVLSQNLTIDGSMYQVTGVADVPDNTHLQFGFLRPSHHNPTSLYTWDHTLAFIYVKLKEGARVGQVEKHLTEIVVRNSTANDASYLLNYDSRLQALSDIHSTVIQWDIIEARSSKELWALFCIAAFILLLSVVNFINLTTAISIERIKETGISKILGASPGKLLLQFFGEYLMLTVLAALVSTLIVVIAMPGFNNLVGSTLMPQELFDPQLLLFAATTVAATAISAGLYPSYRLSRFTPREVLNRSKPRTNSRVRKVLVVAQFCISITLIAGTQIVREQTSFLMNADLGIDRDSIYVLRMRPGTIDRFSELAGMLSQRTSVTAIAGASSVIGGEPGSDTFHPDHMREQTTDTFAKNIAIDTGYVKLFGIKILEGRSFSGNRSEFQTSYIINQRAASQYKLTSPVGANLIRSSDTVGTVIGVMKDFQFSKMTEKIQPMVFYIDSIRSHQYMFIKYTGPASAIEKDVASAWQAVIPDLPMEGFFQDSYFNALYVNEQQTGRVIALFAAIGLFIACLGLFGIASFVTLRRTKEIGIRKAVGATTHTLIALLSSEFIKLVLIAFLLSIPLIYFLGQAWLESFVARIPFSFTFFLFSGFVTSAVALLTVLTHVLRAARINPVEALREQ
ncbi:MAG TPA: ABC transporter permease [Chryseosolibacter sp.]